MFNIKIELKELKGNKIIFESLKFNDLDEDYDIDCILLDICERLDNLKKVKFVISGFGDEEWNVDCKADLPCILEQMEEILNGVVYKHNFTIDLYEQGMEREIEFEFKDENVTLTCKSYVGNLPPELLIFVPDDKLYKIFLEFFNDFIKCIEIFLPEYLDNGIFIEWVNNNKKLLKYNN